MEVCHSFIVIPEPLGLFFVVDPQISFIAILLVPLVSLCSTCQREKV
jgi:hypothetical protein